MAPANLERRKRKLAHVKKLGKQLLSSKAHEIDLDIVAHLLDVISPASPPEHLIECILSLQPFFTTVIPELPPKRQRLEVSPEDAEISDRMRLRSYFDKFMESLIDVLIAPDVDEGLREVVLDTLMEFVKLGSGGGFRSALYCNVMDSIVHTTVPVDFLSTLLVTKYFKYIDVRYFTYINLEKFAKSLAKDASVNKAVCCDVSNVSQLTESLELSIHKIHYIISHVPPPESVDENCENEMWSGSCGVSLSHMDKQVLSPDVISKRMKLRFAKAWISFLRLPLPLDVYKEVLAALHQAVIPYLSSPLILCDFLTRSYEIGGVVSVMALSSLYILMTEHGLEYPDFYIKLYALLVPSIFMAKHRAKFFQLLDSSLKSRLLPAYLAAAFAKKLSRLALVVTPSGAMVIIALIHNLLRRHPSINFLVHQERVDETANDDSSQEDEPVEDSVDLIKGTDMSSESKPGVDYFKNEETNPINSNSMVSSLWEIDTLRHHYCPLVSRFVLSLENDLTVGSKTTDVNIEDFSSGSYATIFGQEMRRRVKQVPLAFYKVTPTTLFSESEFVGWTFKYGESTDKAAEEAPEDDIASKRQRIG